jgi:hypothetical protein
MKYRSILAALAGFAILAGCSNDSPTSFNYRDSDGYLAEGDAFLLNLEEENGITSTSKMTYIIEVKGNSIKFEDAGIGLGEDKVVETDYFEIEVAGPLTQISVTTKASTGSATYILTPDQPSFHDELGFMTTIVKLPTEDSPTLIIAVTSVDPPHALSHVTFTLTEDATIQTPGNKVDVNRHKYDLEIPEVPDVPEVPDKPEVPEAPEVPDIQ